MDNKEVSSEDTDWILLIQDSNEISGSRKAGNFYPNKRLLAYKKNSPSWINYKCKNRKYLKT
jgi:hypothetical protein